MKKFELLVDGYHTPLTAAEIAELFHAKRLRRSDPCREIGAKTWQTIDEQFPLLKYDSSRSSSVVPPSGGGRVRSAFDGSDEPGDIARPMSSALKAGWICFGIALLLSWFFPLANLFFSVAIVTAIVAMCTHQVNRGLALLISSFVGITLCAVIFFMLVVGTIGVAAGAAMKQADESIRKQQAQQQQALRQMSQANQRLQSATTNPFAALATPPPMRTISQTQTAPRFDQQSTYDTAAARAREEQQRQAADDQKRQAAIHEAERQRDTINAKQERLKQIQNSIDWNDHMISQMRDHNGNPKLFQDQRDSLLQEKAKLQGY